MSDGSAKDDTTPVHGIPLLTRRDLMNAVKEGAKELIREYVEAWGWFSAKTLMVAAICAAVVLILWANGYAKVH
jgi:hypothetical protein